MASIIKVDNVQNTPGTNIVSKCGTDVTLGASGDTIALASGASQTGFGRTGTVDWITTPKVTGDSPVTGVTGKGYFLNTTAGEITINLPAGSAGDIISMADYAATWQTNKVTVAPNGSEKIGSLNENATLSTEGQSVTFVYVDSTQGWLNTMDSTSNVRGAPPFMIASGGTPCSGAICGNYKIHTFTAPGTFTVCCVAGCAGQNVVSYMVVAGGGGSINDRGGAGGAGGYREYKNSCDPYTASPLDGNPGGTAITVTATAYPIAIGAGGAAQPCTTPPGNDGSDSTFSTITSTGGGGGGKNPGTGNSGGSGGGGGPAGAGGTGNSPSVSPAQGTNGGGGSPASPPVGNGGGGGATVAGTAGLAGSGGAGGTGAGTGINPSPSYGAPGPCGSLRYFGGGGGGGHDTSSPGAAGVGGGGKGAKGPYPAGSVAADAGTVNTGGGAGGANGGGPSVCAKAGGSGVVIIRYKFQ